MKRPAATPRKVTTRHRVELLLLRAPLALLSRLPPRLGDALAGLLGGFVYRVAGWRRGVVESQLAAAYPDASREWVRRVARACYAHFVREMVAVVAFSRRGPEALLRCVEYRGLEELRAAAEAGGALIVSGHYGNWELAASSVAARGIPMYGVYQPQSNAPVDAWVARLRESLGIRLVRRGESAAAARRILRSGGVLGLAADQDARARGVFVPFFGRPASTHRGPAALALALGAPLFIGIMRRVGPGRRYRLEIELVRPASEPAAGERDEGGEGRDSVREWTARWVAALERAVRVSPEQYLWHHRRWKSRPPGTRGLAAGTTSGPTTPDRETRSA